MTTRRNVLVGGVAAGLAPALSWADAGQPAYLAAARHGDGSYWLHGLDGRGRDVFARPMPGRGHAAAAHPSSPLAVVFARRPGTFALVIDCVSGTVIHRLSSPSGRHFYGHGCFSADGSLLFTTENDYDAGTGRIGLWAVGEGVRRIGEISSGGIGPHDVLRLPGTEILAVANGGIQTHPDTGRAKLNLATMQPNLTYLTTAGVIAQHHLDDAMRLNSIRHLAVREDGLVALAMQWQGPLDAVPPLLALHGRGDPTLGLLAAPGREQRRTRGYAGSIAFSGDGGGVAITAPRGGRAHLFDVETGVLRASVERPDICGIAASFEGHLATDGHGGVLRLSTEGRSTALSQATSRAWDNHLVKL